MPWINGLTLPHHMLRPFVILSSFLLIGGCEPSPRNLTHQDQISLYNDLIDQIFWEYAGACMNSDEKIDPSLNYANADSVKSFMRSRSPMCVLEYHDEIGMMYRSQRLSPGSIDDIKGELETWTEIYPTIVEGANVQTVADSITITSKLKTNELSVNYLEVVQHDTSSREKGMGVVGFSKAYYSRDFYWAVVYFEFFCGVKCAHGELVYLHYVNNRWVIQDRHESWIE
jgi:hypothetical protein